MSSFKTFSSPQNRTLYPLSSNSEYDIYSIICTYCNLCLCSALNGSWTTFYFSQILLLWTHIYKYLLSTVFSFWGCILRNGFLGPMAVLCLLFRGTFEPFSTLAEPLYTSSSSAQGLQFLDLQILQLT